MTRLEYISIKCNTSTQDTIPNAVQTEADISAQLSGRSTRAEAEQRVAVNSCHDSFFFLSLCPSWLDWVQILDYKSLGNKGQVRLLWMLQWCRLSLRVKRLPAGKEEWKEQQRQQQIMTLKRVWGWRWFGRDTLMWWNRLRDDRAGDLKRKKKCKMRSKIE